MSTPTNQENVSPGATTCQHHWPTPVLGGSPEQRKVPGAPVVRDRHQTRMTGGVDGAGDRAKRRLDFTDVNALD
jgi:hypothetical protein